MSLDVLSARVAFRDRPVADVLDLALRFVFVHGAAYAKVWIATALPLLALTIATAKSFGWGVAWPVTALCAVIAETPFTILASRLVFEDRVRARDVLRAALRGAPLVVLGKLFASALVLCGLFFFFVPGIWAAAVTFFLGEVMLLERSGLGGAFGRAHRIASSAFGETLVATIAIDVVLVLGVLLSDVCGRTFVEQLLQFTSPEPVWAHGGSALALLGVFVLAPYVATARFFAYLNVRTRSEGWDVQTRFAALAARAEAERAATEAS